MLQILEVPIDEFMVPYANDSDDALIADLDRQSSGKAASPSGKTVEAPALLKYASHHLSPLNCLEH